MKIFLLLAFIVTFFSNAGYADTKITILHTSDIHGHFTNQDSPIRLGGISRLKAKIDFLRKKNQNVLLLDSGDWSEGTIFYTLNSGEANHRMMEAMGYDVIVLGNHEWLVGPKALYEAFEAAQFKVPIVAANLNMPTNNKDFHLEKYIKPYVIKNIGGKKVGIFGLTTFQLVFDSFFEPVEIKEPIKTALKVVKKLRQDEKCDVVILLSHLGIGADKSIAESVPGIDLIVGGHTHILTKKPVISNGVPIVHIGTWAQYVGEYELTVPDNGRPTLTKHIIHQIDENTQENSLIQGMVDGFQKKIEDLRGKIFNDNIFQSEVNLPLGNTITEDSLADWAVDAIRKAAKTPLAFDVGEYYRRSMYPGTSSTVDFFNMFPHVYNKVTNKNWTILTMDVKAQTLLQMINIMSKLGQGVRVSGATYQIDGSSTLNSVKNFFLDDGNTLETGQFYHIAATQGIFQAFDTIKKLGADVGVHNVHDTGIEAWKVIRDEVRKKSPVKAESVGWQGRVRTVQPDIYVPLEQVVVTKVDAKTVSIKYKIINAGLTAVTPPSAQVKINITKNTVDEDWLTKNVNSPDGQKLIGAGDSFETTVKFTRDSWQPGYYEVQVSATVDKSELNKNNNTALGYFRL